MASPEDGSVNPYLRAVEDAQQAEAERSRVALEEGERAGREAALMEVAAREMAERYAVAVQQAAQDVRMGAMQAAEALRRSGLSRATILSADKSLHGWIMWRKWLGSYIEFNSISVYEGVNYPEQAYGFILTAEGSILVYQDLPAHTKIQRMIHEDQIVSSRDATDTELAQGVPCGATKLTRGIPDASDADLSDQDPDRAALRWQKLFQELIADSYRRAEPKQPDREDEVARLKRLIVAAPNAQWIARRGRLVSYTRSVFRKSKPIYEDLEPVIWLGPLKWEFGTRDAPPSTRSVDSGLTARGRIVLINESGYAAGLREPVLEPLRRVARSLGLIP
jgi:hypothetical protein